MGYFCFPVVPYLTLVLLLLKLVWEQYWKHRLKGCFTRFGNIFLYWRLQKDLQWWFQNFIQRDLKVQLFKRWVFLISIKLLSAKIWLYHLNEICLGKISIIFTRYILANNFLPESNFRYSSNHHGDSHDSRHLTFLVTKCALRKKKLLLNL